MAETGKHRDAFECYFRLGTKRSIERLHVALATNVKAPSLRTLYEWSRRYDWQRRIQDLERVATESADAARIAAVREMQERHAQEGVLLQQVGARALASMDAADLSADEAIRAIKEGVNIERLARGEVTERSEVKSAGDPRVEELTDDELERAIAFATGAVPRIERAES